MTRSAQHTLDATLYGYWRSSASFRVRIALGLKGVSVAHAPVNLANGEQFETEHGRRNTQALVPVLALASGDNLAQSVAIIDYLEKLYPTPALLPADPIENVRIRAAANIIAADTAPLQNLRVLKRLKSQFSANDNDVGEWVRHWIGLGLESLEKAVQNQTKQHAYLFGDKPGYAECFLIPQIYNGKRFGLDISAFPKLDEVDQKCQKLDAFIDAHPDNQPDAVR